MGRPLYRYTVNSGEVKALAFTPEMEAVAHSIHESMRKMDASGFDAGEFQVSHFHIAADRAVYYLTRDGDYFCFTSACLHEADSAGAWEAAERQFLEAAERIAPELDLGWQPDAQCPPVPWFASVLFPIALNSPDTEMITRFGVVEACVSGRSCWPSAKVYPAA